MKGFLSEVVSTLKASKEVIKGTLACPLPSIRSKTIILFLLFSCVPLLASRFVGLPKVRKAFQEARIRDLESVGHKQAELISVWMKERKADVAAISKEYLTSSFLEFKPGDREFEELTSYLKFIKDNYGYKEISLADDQGKIRVSTREDFLGLSVAEFDYFREALKGNVFVTRVHPSVFPIQNEFGEMERGVPTLFISGPIRDDRHRIIGVVSLWVDVAALSKEMRRVKLGETGETYLVDEGGYMITESRFVSTIREKGLIKKRTALELKLIDPTTDQLTKGVQACLKGECGYDAEGYPDYRGVKVLGFWHWIPEYNWGLMSEIDVEEAYRDLNKLRKTLISIVFAFTVVTVAVAIFLGRRLTAPILHLTEVTKRMSSGDFSQRATVSTRDEIGQLAESFNTMLETINNNIKEIQLLHSQRMGTMGPSLEKPPILLNKLVEHVLGKVASQLELLKILLVKELTPEAITISGNHEQLRMVLINLISSAIDAMPEGGTLRVETEHLASEDKVQVAIHDTGPEIDKKDLPYLFDPYFILKIRPSKRSTGLELALAQLTVQSHGGTIEADSKTGKGTTFRVKLPLYHEAASSGVNQGIKNTKKAIDTTLLMLLTLYF